MVHGVMYLVHGAVHVAWYMVYGSLCKVWCMVHRAMHGACQFAWCTVQCRGEYIYLFEDHGWLALEYPVLLDFLPIESHSSAEADRPLQ